MERTWLVGAAALAVAIVAAVWFGRSQPGPPPLEVVSEPQASATITVHVSGAVLHPGLVKVSADARVADAISAAGGAAADADLAAINLAAVMRDGDQIIVPGRSGDGGSVGAVEDGRVRINAATAEQLEQLPGVGPVLAQRIADHRERSGPFNAVEDLLDVPGIGEGKLAALRDAVIVP